MRVRGVVSPRVNTRLQVVSQISNKKGNSAIKIYGRIAPYDTLVRRSACDDSDDVPRPRHFGARDQTESRAVRRFSSYRNDYDVRISIGNDIETCVHERTYVRFTTYASLS